MKPLGIEQTRKMLRNERPRKTRRVPSDDSLLPTKLMKPGRPTVTEFRQGGIRVRRDSYAGLYGSDMALVGTGAVTVSVRMIAHDFGITEAVALSWLQELGLSTLPGKPDRVLAMAFEAALLMRYVPEGLRQGCDMLKLMRYARSLYHGLLIVQARTLIRRWKTRMMRLAKGLDKMSAAEANRRMCITIESRAFEDLPHVDRDGVLP